MGGEPVRLGSSWIAGDRFADEVPFALALRDELVGLGFDPGIGMLVDTSCNGWGGPERPMGPGPLTTADEYVEHGRLDRRLSPAHWCNQAGVGLDGADAPEGDPGSGLCTACGSPGGALRGGPAVGEWFPEHFASLLAHAWPPLP
ncbi:glycoside hydrolase family 6 protein [Streptomyces sp. PT12]|uniref:glycoside hydrolase family 6 protein n=1 Tax=Streptomyces sp. PT12 TaxID=1510197 RepID=UPI000DE33EAC|nr:glycoside hydrolase family 6 protein [Streptomyces sp. PT12]RBM16105.1 hypothetical protein DEH69_17025 [Streptomyces sp. PT12]